MEHSILTAYLMSLEEGGEWGVARGVVRGGVMLYIWSGAFSLEEGVSGVWLGVWSGGVWLYRV